MIYTSKGTVRVEFEVGDNGILAAAKELFFVPDSDYSIKHGKKTFAVFVPHSGRPIFREYDQDKEIRIKTKQVPPYDCTKTKVEVKVKELPKDTAAACAAAAFFAAMDAMTAAKDKWSKADGDEAAAAEVVEQWEKWRRANEKAEEAMKDEATYLKLISITIPAAK